MNGKIYHLFSVSVLVLAILTLFMSCSRVDREENENNGIEEISGYKISNFLDKDKILELKKSVVNKKANIKEFSVKSSMSVEKYDFDSVKKIEDNLGNTYYSVPKMDNPKEVLGLIPFGKTFKFIEVSVEDLSNGNIRTIELRNLDNTFSAKFGYDKSNNSVIKYDGYQNKVGLKTLSNDTSIMSSGCGQGVIDCMSNIYTKRGWTSVAATLFTAYAPQIGVAVAAGCAASRCL
ncbi:hypothetical protein [Riemerella anatipestifer]|uniref:hypothetical protein n=2 Tax=Riemerella anatipestifer TaxID=34085 RepID=UPI0021D5BF51|nr:hypothetical protein [Riemerella anatipestifer]MCU7542248.1 hypothetical protein [Riemerella anatipestifer]MCW0513141.1 hypothetical protein [Riemerella anatipestifer]